MYFSLAKMDKLCFSTVHEQETLKQMKEGENLISVIGRQKKDMI